MTCAVCGTKAPDVRHEFRTIAGSWTIVATLWFKSAPDNRSAIEGYCGPECSLVAYERKSAE